jgi:hypothetical protein
MSRIIFRYHDGEKEMEEERSEDEIFLQDGTGDENKWVYISRNLGESGLFQNWPISGAVFEEPVTLVEEGTFYGCSLLKTVSLASTIERIEICAFAYCASLQDIKLPQNLKLIADRVFNRCSSLVEISLPRSIKFLGKYAFGNCGRLEVVNMWYETAKKVDHRYIAHVDFKGSPLTQVFIGSPVRVINFFVAGRERVSASEAGDMRADLRFILEIQTLHKINFFTETGAPLLNSVGEPVSFSTTNFSRSVRFANEMLEGFGTPDDATGRPALPREILDNVLENVLAPISAAGRVYRFTAPP